MVLLMKLIMLYGHHGDISMMSTFSADECGDGDNARGSPWCSWRYADTRRKYTSDCSAGFGNIKVSELLRGGN